VRLRLGSIDEQAIVDFRAPLEDKYYIPLGANLGFMFGSLRL
jgi:hypothetical protein